MFFFGFFFSDYGHRICQTLRPQEGHERNLQGEIPPHTADPQQDPEVKQHHCSAESESCVVVFSSYHPALLLPHSLKREIKKLAQDECGYEEPTVAMAFVYFEKLVLQGKLNKQNRKLCAGACVLLAAKIGGDLKKHEVKLLIDVSFPRWAQSFPSIRPQGTHTYWSYQTCKISGQ